MLFRSAVIRGGVHRPIRMKTVCRPQCPKLLTGEQVPAIVNSGEIHQVRHLMREIERDAYNIQPGVEIDYATGESWLSGETKEIEEQREYTDEEKGTEDYMINTSTKKFHHPDCSSIINTKEENKESFNGPRQWLIENGYEPCGKCKP